MRKSALLLAVLLALGNGAALATVAITAAAVAAAISLFKSSRTTVVTARRDSA